MGRNFRLRRDHLGIHYAPHHQSGQVAQLVEQLAFNQLVLGSSPSLSISPLLFLLLFLLPSGLSIEQSAKHSRGSKIAPSQNPLPWQKNVKGRCYIASLKPIL